MSRRDTIIISVLVNAALLAVLFITAVTSKNTVQEDTKLATSINLEETTMDAKELFSANIENKEIAVKKETQEEQREFVSLMEENQDVKKEEEKVIYKLPDIDKNTQEVKKLLTSAAHSTNPVVPLNSFTVKVKKGDTLEKIAKANHIKISELVKINNLADSFLKVGQELIVPKQNLQKTQVVKNEPKPKVELTVSAQAEYYTIKVGDNPYTIAVKHNLKLNDILKLNNLDEKKARKLKPGDKLRIR